MSLRWVIRPAVSVSPFQLLHNNALQVEALIARDGHHVKQVEMLKAELARLRGGNRTEHLAALHDEALQEV